MVRAELERRATVLVEPLERAVLDGVHPSETGARLDERGEAGAVDGERIRVDLGLIPVFVDERPLIGLAGLLDWRSSGRLSAILRSNFFRGAITEQLLMPGERRWPFDRLVILGLGSRAEFGDARARDLGARCVEIATGLDASSVLIALPSASIERGLIEVAFDSLLSAWRSSSDAREPHEAPESAALESQPVTGEAESEPEVASEAESDAKPEVKSELPPTPEPKPEPRVEAEPEPRELRCWVVVDESVVARLRRVRSGPPRAARGSSLYT